MIRAANGGTLFLDEIGELPPDIQPYPGNMREPKNSIERALAYFPDQAVLQAEHLRLPRARGVSLNPTR